MTVLNRYILENLLNKLNNITDEFYTETKTMFSVTKIYCGHEIALSGPKIQRHHWGVAMMKFPQRSNVRLVKTRMKINGAIVCDMGPSIYNHLAYYNMVEGNHVETVRINVYHPITPISEREKGVLFLKLLLPDLFNKENNPIF